MFDSESTTRLPSDSELLKAFIAKLPREVVEQFVNNWRGQTDAPEHVQGENRLIGELLRRLQTEK
jgi:hypothetical protein